MLKKIRKFDLGISTIYIILITISLFVVYSNTFNAEIYELRYGKFNNHLVFVGLGILAFFVAKFVSVFYVRIKNVIIFIGIINIILLILVLFQPEVSNVHRWLNIFGLQFQIGEFSKIFFLFSTAYLANKLNNIKSSNYANIAIISILVLISLALIFIEPAGSLTIINFLIILISIIINNKYKFNLLIYCLILASFICKWIGLDFFFYIILSIPTILVIFQSYILRNYKITFKYFIFMILLIILPIIFGIIYNSSLIPTYQKSRLNNYFSESNQDYSFQQDKAVSQIASGGIFGKGYLMGTKKIGVAVPFLYTDFAMTGFIEENGIIGLFLIFLLLFLILLKVTQIISKNTDTYTNTVVTFIFLNLFINFILSTLVNLGYFVNTGIPTPFISYSGTTLIINSFFLGLLENISKNVYH